MKNKKVILFSILLSISFLAGCGGGKGNDDVKPTTKEEKITTAFKGVESSLKNQKGKKNNRYIKNRVNEKDALTTIYKAMTNEGETSNPDFRYDEPPMIQFQYLKALYEESKDTFSFNTKYIHKLTGDIYYDFSTNEEVHEKQYKYHYDFDFSFSLNIDDNDLISAKVLFDITYTHDEDSHHQYQYASLLLDYDMDEQSPTYNLIMKDYTDLLSDDLYNSVEYDYVNVDKGSIVEWRKFGICAPTSIKYYKNNEFIYNFSVLRGYKDLTKYNRTIKRRDEATKIALIEGFNLDSFIDEYVPFKNASGTKNDKIQVVVDRFNQIFGKDFVYHIAYSGVNEDYSEDREPIYDNLNLKINCGVDDYEISIKGDVGDFLFSDLFNENNGDLPTFSFDLYSGDEVLVETISDLSRVDMTLQTYYYSSSYIDTDAVEVDLNSGKKFSDYLRESGFVNLNNDGYLLMKLTASLNDIEDVEKIERGISLFNNVVYEELSSDFSLVDKYFNTYLSIKDEIPYFDSENIIFTPRVYDDGLSCGFDMSGKNISYYIDLYTEMLVNELDFILDTNNGTYSKRINEEYVLKVIIGQASIGYEFIKKSEEKGTITDKIKEYLDNDEIKIPDFEDYEFEIKDSNMITIIGNIEETLVSDYISSLSDYGFVVGDNEAIKYYEGVFYRICQLGVKVIGVFKGEGSVSILGDFSNWDVKDTNNDIKTFSYLNKRYCFETNISINKGQAFKFVKNHSWADGGYGFNHLEPDSMKYFECGEYDNIIALDDIDCHIKLDLDLMIFDSLMENNNFFIFSITIEKKQLSYYIY